MMSRLDLTPASSPLPPHAPSTGALARQRVLVVDDDESVASACRRTLERVGCVVTTAADGVEAMRCVSADDFDLVVSDIDMPGLGGLELLKGLRGADSDVPFIIITGAPSVETAVSSLNHGAVRYLTKPLDPSELSTAAMRAVGQRRLAELRNRMGSVTAEETPLDDRASERNTFRSAIEQLYMVFQPIVRWPSRDVVGHEALVRTGETAVPNPGVLFEVAERLDQVNVLSRAIYRACGAALPKAPVGSLLFINLHSRDLREPALITEDSGLLEFSERIVFEITERASLKDLEGAHASISRLREQGFRVAIDDIGAGYAGLSSFALLEPDIVKLDMGLIRGVDASPTKQKLIGSFCSLCQAMQTSVVAEGVETIEERDTLASLGCELFQGYLFQKPRPGFTEVL